MKESRFSHENVEFIFHHLDLDHIAKSWKRGVFYELELLQWIKDKGLTGTYVDVGSHQGNHTIYFSKMCMAEKVVGIEGNPFYFELLEENTSLNECDNVVLHNIIASNEEDADVELFFNKSNTGNTSAYDFKHSTQKVVNKTSKLDNLLIGEEVTLIKLDIQDMEWFALQGCRNTIRKNKPLLILEWNWNSNQYIHEINTLLKEYDYKLIHELNVPSLVHIYEAQ